MKRSLWFALIMMGSGALSACGPIGYHYSVSLNAAQALAEAKAANAEKLAPYEYWSAVTYLTMAREKASYADYQNAWDYGERSEAASQKAKRIASEKGEEGPGAERETHAPTEVIDSQGTAVSPAGGK